MTAPVDLKSAAPVRLLLIEDSPSDAMLLEESLRGSAVGTAAIECEATLHGALKRLAAGPYDGVLVDLGLPDSDGLDTFLRVKRLAGTAAVIVVTALDDARLGEESVRLGAQDYLLKGESRPGSFGRAVDYAIWRMRVLRELEAARDEQLEAKDRFLSHVSHELRAPLSVVHQFGSLLLDGLSGPLSGSQPDHLAILMRNVGQLRSMVDDLMEAGRAQDGLLAIACRPTEIRALLTDTVADYGPAADRQQVTLAVVAGELPTVWADMHRLRAVLSNLVDNALKYMGGSGRIVLQASAEPNSVHVTVRDTGRGIPPDQLDRIFERFFQVEQGDHLIRGGLGLGLFVCRDLIERQGGRMWAESRAGQGTAMHFTVPVLPTLTEA